MDLLPKSSSDFSQLDYWNKFFKSRGTKAFEWFDYPTLSDRINNNAYSYLKFAQVWYISPTMYNFTQVHLCERQHSGWRLW